MPNPSDAVRRRGGCPICGAPPSAATTPFCGPRCRDRDLLRWLGEGYALPGPPAPDDANDDEV